MDADETRTKIEELIIRTAKSILDGQGSCCFDFMSLFDVLFVLMYVSPPNLIEY